MKVRVASLLLMQIGFFIRKPLGRKNLFINSPQAGTAPKVPINPIATE
jgi:hypothetical protein